jgi:hypothetical protein
MREIERDDLVVGVEYTLDKRGNKAHYVGRNDEEETLFFMSAGPNVYYADREGFVIFDTSGDPFFLEEDI